MNKKQTITEEIRNWRAYHVPGMGNYTTRPKNGIFLSAANSWEHEKEKCHQCHVLLKRHHKFITEASCNKTNLRRDIVDITDGTIIEIETTRERAERFKSDPMADKIIVVKLWVD